MKLYYKNRAEAGRLLAEKLEYLRGRRVVVLCLSEGATVVGAQIAMSLHAKMVLYKIRQIFLPNEFEAIAGLSSSGDFKFSNLLSPGQIEEIVGEYHTYLDQEMLQKNHEMNVLLGRKGEIKTSLLRHHDIIIVGDVLTSGFSVEMAASYLNTLAIGKTIAAVPIVSLDALDQLHITVDEIRILGVTENIINPDHYFDDNTLPDTAEAIKIMQNIRFGWRRRPILHRK